MGLQHRREAYRLLSTECDATDPHVQYLLGLCYDNGFGCIRDKAHAAQCLERAANHIAALSELADVLLQRPIYDHRAIALYKHAATQGHGVVQNRLAEWYERGIPGVLEKDIAQAKHWYSLAAEQGHDLAAWALRRLNN
eukprot:TRINITY_DN6786_c0_g1_i2.p1 TRINITY_DN6786_c0_g1~~TRINITY_DN6786_c0_g1_i2.p1  ORF type:complete len:139 (-),score=31.00 TRINITY_DN6786_c0_g1_i2:272-688(-)